VVGVDLDGAAAVPGDPDVAAVVDVLHHAPIAGGETGALRGIRDELDARPDRDARLDAGRKKSCAEWIHGRLIGFDTARLEPSNG
jgi:hypothetical protein